MYGHLSVHLTRRSVLAGAAAAFAGFALTRLTGYDDVAVDWMWSGGVGADGGKVVAKLGAAATSCRLKVSTAPDLRTRPIFSRSVADDANGYVRMTVTGLSPDTRYHYGIEIDSNVNALRGQFHTHPESGSFLIAFGSCSNNDSNHRVFDAIREATPLFFAHLGDFFYADIAINDEAAFRTAYEGAMAQARRARMHREVANVYVWDNHDYGNGAIADGAGATAIARPAAAAVYRQAVPHYALPTGNEPICQSFVVGRVRFILTDLRHGRSDDTATDDSSKTMLGEPQKTWFKARLDDARDEGAGLVVWLNSQVWRVDPPFTGIDVGGAHWGGFATERTELADYIKENDIPQVMILGGDAHMVAYDDGTHADYATGGGAPIPEFHASALDVGGSRRGTNWMSGVSEGGGRYGLVSFSDDGEHITVVVSAYEVNDTSGVQTLIRRFQFQTAS